MYLAEAQKQHTNKQHYSHIPKDHTPEVAFEIETFLAFLYTKEAHHRTELLVLTTITHRQNPSVPLIFENTQTKHTR